MIFSDSSAISLVDAKKLQQENDFFLSSRESQRSNKFTKLLMKILKDSDFDQSIRCRHAALIVKGGVILGIGINRVKMNRKMVLPIKLGLSKVDINRVTTIHAEVSAIMNVKNKKNLHGATLYVARAFQNKELMSCPCDLCLFHLREHKIRTVVFSTENGWREGKP